MGDERRRTLRGAGGSWGGGGGVTGAAVGDTGACPRLAGPLRSGAGPARGIRAAGAGAAGSGRIPLRPGLWGDWAARAFLPPAFPFMSLPCTALKDVGRDTRKWVGDSFLGREMTLDGPG